MDLMEEVPPKTAENIVAMVFHIIAVQKPSQVLGVINMLIHIQIGISHLPVGP